MGCYQVYQALFTVRHGIISEVRGAFSQLTGFTKERLLNKGFEYVFKDLLKATADLKRVKPGAQPVSCFIFSGKYEARKVSMSAFKSTDGSGLCYKVEEIPGTRFIDRFRVMEKLFDDDNLGACILSVPEMIVLKANNTFMELLGCDAIESCQEASGHPLDDLIAQELQPGVKRDLARVIQSEEPHYSNRLINMARRRYCSINLIPINEHHQIRYILAIVKDISEYVLEMEKSRERKKQLEIILENMNDGLIITDSKANILMMNAAARAYYKEPDDMKELSTCFDKAMVTDMDGNPVPIESMPTHRALRGEKVKNFRVAINGWTGRKFFEYNSSPLYDQNGSIIMTISCCRDVTDQVEREEMVKAHQEELFKAELSKNEALRKAMELKDEFLSLISHEFKTPISVIIAAIQAMEALCGGQFDERAKAYIRRIRQNAYRQLRLVNNLLEIARISSGQVRLHVRNYDIVFLTSSITGSVIPYADQKGVKVSFSSSIRQKIIGIDEEKYERILLNLLSNAIKFTPAGKSVFVRVSYAGSKQGSQVCVAVEDEGVGIPEDKQEMIFEKFGQVDSAQAPGAGGTGLGLPLAKLYTELLGGSISLKSQAGQGTCFTLLLPDKKADLAESAAEEQACGANHPIQQVAVEFSDLYPVE